MASYSTTFPDIESPLSEGGMWSKFPPVTYPAGVYEVGYVGSSTTSGGNKTSWLDGYPFDSDNLFVKATLSIRGTPTANQSWTLHTRINETTYKNYLLAISHSHSTGAWAMYLYERDPTGGPTIASIDPYPSSLDGCEIELRIEGSSIYVFVDGVEKISATNSTYTSGSIVAIGSGNQFCGWADFSAGDYGLAAEEETDVEDFPLVFTETEMKHWLLDLDVSGSTLRYGSAGLDADGRHYLGALTMTSPPELSVDPYTFKSTAATATMSLFPVANQLSTHPQMRPCDIADTFGVPLVGMAARLYRYDSDTGVKELIVKGFVRDPSADEAGRLTITVVDFSERWDKVKLPIITIGDTFDIYTPDEDDVGRKLPIAYGTFKGVEIPNIGGGGDRHAIGHFINESGITGGRVGTTSETPSVTNTTGADGVEYARITYPTSDTENKDCTVNGTGVFDDTDGTYTGTASSLLESVADQLHHLAVEFVGIPAADVDVGAFVGFRVAHANHVNALVIGPDDDTTYFDVAADALRPYRAACYVERGKLKVRRLSFTDTPVAHLRQEENLVRVQSVEWRGYDDVPAGIEFLYNRGWRTKKKAWELRSSIKVEPEDFPPFLAAQSYGNDMETIEAPHVQDADTAALLVTTQKELYSIARKHVLAQVRDCDSLNIFDCVLLTSAVAPSASGAGWDGKRFVVTGIAYGLDTSTLTLLEV